MPNDYYPNIGPDAYLAAFVGKGLVFPITLTAGRAPITQGFELISHNLTTLLDWMVGTRFMQGEFGSLLTLLVEEPNDIVLQGLAKKYIVDAINAYEKRIVLVPGGISFKRVQPENLEISLTYKLANADYIEASFVYPFYTSINT